MRKLAWLFPLCAASLAASLAASPARAQQVFSAPTNMLRIAECQAALGRLVESSESYRAVVRTPLPAGSPPAFQAAVEQAKAELSQVDPRVPKVTVQVQPPSASSASGLQLQIDGQAVPAALLGEAIPLDPGTHKVIVLASGYVSAEQAVTLKERDAKTLTFTLKPISSVTYAPGTGPSAPPLPPPPAQGQTPSQTPGQTPGPAPAPAPYEGPSQAGGNVPPPPPQVEGPPALLVSRQSRMGLLFGGHLGWQAPLGNLPIDSNTTVDAANVSGGGFTYAIDGGLRFARSWYVGLSLEHATLGQGKNIAAVNGSAASVTSDTTLLALILAFIGNPNRTSAYFEAGLANRWYGFTATDAGGNKLLANGYSSGEVLLGLGMWIPAGNSLRILPKVTLGLGSFSPPNSGSSTSSSGTTNAFVMLGIAGFYNLDL
jgi:hypothetical protein